MEWLRSVDLAEYAPNLRGSGVHGGLMVRGAGTRSGLDEGLGETDEIYRPQVQKAVVCCKIHNHFTGGEEQPHQG